MKIAAEGFSCLRSIHLTIHFHRHLPVVMPSLRAGDGGALGTRLRRGMKTECMPLKTW